MLCVKEASCFLRMSHGLSSPVEDGFPSESVVHLLLLYDGIVSDVNQMKPNIIFVCQLSCY